MSHRLTASKLALADLCPPSHVLDWFVEEDSGDAARGTAIHRALEQVPLVGIDAAVAGMPDDWARVVRAVAETPAIAPLLEPGASAQELALAWDHVTDTAATLGTGRESYAKADPGLTTGTSDLAAVTDFAAHVLDYKAGRMAVAHPSKNLQLRFLGLALARAAGRDHVFVSIVYAREDADAVVVTAEFDCLDLESIADQVRDIRSRVESVKLGEGATYNRGPHCTEMHCPARKGCPAWVGLVRWVMKDVPAFQGQVTQAVSMGAIVAAWEMVQNAKKAAGMMEAEIRRLAYGTPLPLGGGKYLAYAAGNERVADPEKVHEVLLRVTTPEVAQAAVTATVTATSSKKQIESALKALPVKAREPVWAELRKAGALAKKFDVRECDAEDVASTPPMEARGV